jgi:hypothetical protein
MGTNCWIWIVCLEVSRDGDKLSWEMRQTSLRLLDCRERWITCQHVLEASSDNNFVVTMCAHYVGIYDYL